MAKLIEIAQALDVKLENHNPKLSDDSLIKKSTGQKRRSWINVEDKKQNLIGSNITTLTNDRADQTGFINDINKPGLVYSQLRGNPLKVVNYVFEVSKNTKENVTHELTPKFLTETLEMSVESLKTALKFLMKNSLIERVEVRVGKLGWSKFKLSTELFSEMAINREDFEMDI